MATAIRGGGAWAPSDTWIRSRLWPSWQGTRSFGPLRCPNSPRHTMSLGETSRTTNTCYRCLLFGRGNYSYINKEREWQQTSGFFGKLTGAHLAFAKVLAEENIISFAAQLHLQNIARFEFFRRNSTRQFGVWVVRHGQMRFALPFTTGPKAGVTDYLPAPHGVPGFAVPVEQVYPCLVPFLELQDGTVIVASDGADAIQPSENGHSVTATWKRWAVAGRKAGATIDPGIRASVAWQVNGNHLRRTETLVSSKPLRLRRWWVAIPSTADYVLTNVEKGSRVDRFESREGTLEFRVLRSDWTIESQLTATGDSALGRGARGPIPLILVLTDRKSTRLNSSHLVISYAVFCLKKKK